jgi:hypothetical protein
VSDRQAQQTYPWTYYKRFTLLSQPLNKSWQNELKVICF